MCEERGAKFAVPENQYLVDNGAMIAWLGVLHAQKEQFLNPEETVCDPYKRTDQVDVVWR